MASKSMTSKDSRPQVVIIQKIETKSFDRSDENQDEKVKVKNVVEQLKKNFGLK